MELGKSNGYCIYSADLDMFLQCTRLPEELSWDWIDDPYGIDKPCNIFFASKSIRDKGYTDPDGVFAESCYYILITFKEKEMTPTAALDSLYRNTFFVYIDLRTGQVPSIRHTVHVDHLDRRRVGTFMKDNGIRQCQPRRLAEMW
jgi:hypothetical protein